MVARAIFGRKRGVAGDATRGDHPSMGSLVDPITHGCREEFTNGVNCGMG